MFFYVCFCKLNYNISLKDIWGIIWFLDPCPVFEWMPAGTLNWTYAIWKCIIFPNLFPLLCLSAKGTVLSIWKNNSLPPTFNNCLLRTFNWSLIHTNSLSVILINSICPFKLLLLESYVKTSWLLIYPSQSSVLPDIPAHGNATSFYCFISASGFGFQNEVLYMSLPSKTLLMITHYF